MLNKDYYYYYYYLLQNIDQISSKLFFLTHQSECGKLRCRALKLKNFPGEHGPP